MKFSSREETIAAISTPPGIGGIGIVRISGIQALVFLKAIFQPKDTSCSYSSHRFYYGHIYHPTEKKIIDEVLAVYMAAPNSYTREDVVEIHCHGSLLILENILELILAGGATLASPGGFTKRAFLNGRIDLTKAEAVIDILSAKTGKGVDLAQEQLSGALYRQIESIRQSLMQMRAIFEVAIDFPDEDMEIVDHTVTIERLEHEVRDPVQRLLHNADRGRFYREGLAIVIVGLPNVGKSSLLNAMLQEDRALVTSVPGTTRDFIEEVVDIRGIPARIIDTAGIREDAEAVEVLGIRRTRERINTADLVLFLLDGSRAVCRGDRTLYDQIHHKPVLPVINKIDLAKGPLPDLSGFLGIGKRVQISAKNHTGIDRLKEAIFDKVTSGGGQWDESSCAPNVRHKQALIATNKACSRAITSLRKGCTKDLIAIDLQESLDSLAEIVGETTTEEILDVIFAQFCLGK